MTYDFAADIEQMAAAVGDGLPPGFTFANVGASDGVASDPIFPLAERLGARGVAAEPVPYVYARLAANYAHMPEVRCEQVAVSDRSGTERMWFVDPDVGGLAYVTQAIGSLDRDHLVETIEAANLRAADIGPTAPIHPGHRGAAPLPAGEGWPDDVLDHVRSVEVEVVTFDGLLARAGLDHVDMVNIDIEGRDFDVFRSIDWERWRPRVLVLETYHMSEAERGVVDDALGPLGLRRVTGFGLFSEVYAV